MTPEGKGVYMDFHHRLLVLMTEKSSPASVAAQCGGGHIEGRKSALDIDAYFAPIKLHTLAGNILLLDEAVKCRRRLAGLLVSDVADNCAVGDSVSGTAQVRMDVGRLFLLLLQTGCDLHGIVRQGLVNEGLDLICKDGAVHDPVLVLGF